MISFRKSRRVTCATTTVYMCTNHIGISLCIMMTQMNATWRKVSMAVQYRGKLYKPSLFTITTRHTDAFKRGGQREKAPNQNVCPHLLPQILKVPLWCSCNVKNDPSPHISSGLHMPHPLSKSSAPSMGRHKLSATRHVCFFLYVCTIYEFRYEEGECAMHDSTFWNCCGLSKPKKTFMRVGGFPYHTYITVHIS